MRAVEVFVLRAELEVTPENVDVVDAGDHVGRAAATGEAHDRDGRPALGELDLDRYAPVAGCGGGVDGAKDEQVAEALQPLGLRAVGT